MARILAGEFSDTHPNEAGSQRIVGACMSAGIWPVTGYSLGDTGTEERVFPVVDARATEPRVRGGFTRRKSLNYHGLHAINPKELCRCRMPGES